MIEETKKPDADITEPANSHQSNTTNDRPDYYLENDLLVFTEEYHRRRGYCCKSGCRHCPYGFKREQ